MDVNEKKLVERMRELQDSFFNNHGVDDIWSNSKIYEILIANNLNHDLIPGHSGSKDAKSGMVEYEYKHFKELSSNHSWTFNDFSETTINNLDSDQITVIFAHIDDSVSTPNFDWFYEIEGNYISDYLSKYTKLIENSRKMINISSNQIEKRLGFTKKYIQFNQEGKYAKELVEIFSIIKKLEDITGINNLLTSNKFWEYIVAVELEHKVNSEQGGRAGAHDAYDKNGKSYEYKVSKNTSWNFQDISDNVLKKYYEDEAIILAVVDKKNLALTSIHSASPKTVVPRLKEKLEEKLQRKGSLRRLQVSLSKGDLEKIKAIKLL